MPVSYQAGEFNSFVGGLVTEASPLTFPENASIDESNFVLDQNGSRRRRLGLDIEPSTIKKTSATSVSPEITDNCSTYTWKNPGGLSGKSLVAIQTEENITIVDRSSADTSLWRYQSFQLVTPAAAPQEIKATFASIDGKLVVAYGTPDVAVFTYDTTNGDISSAYVRIEIRDLFGVAATLDSKDLWKVENVTYRPAPYTLNPDGITQTERHLYNLRNQGWMRPKARWHASQGVAYTSGPNGWHTMAEPISDFRQPAATSFDYLPSMADQVAAHLYPRTDGPDPDQKDIVRFDADSSRLTPPPNTTAPKGSFVIDLFDRGAGRQLAHSSSYENYRTSMGDGQPTVPYYLSTAGDSVPTDRSEGGVRATAEFAGRVWFGGFDGTLTDGDELSPDLGSYVTYSQQVKDFTDIGKCYQVADPTNPDDPERVATDGGFIRLSGCANIKTMVNIGNDLVVLAETGVWSIGGTSNGVFDATNQEVSKISEFGSVNSRAVVLVEGSIMYWSEDAIYQIAYNEVGDLVVKEVSVNIRSLYQGISYSDKAKTFGAYDSYDKKVRWIYENSLTTGAFKELVFDIKLAAFYPSETVGLQTTDTPVILGYAEVPPYNIDLLDNNVVAGTDNVVAGVDNVVAEIPTTIVGFRELTYITMGVTSNQYWFSTYNNTEFKDWYSIDSTGVDAPAYLVTGYISTGDNARYKQIPYIYFHFLRTETGFTDSGNDLVPVGESSCLVQSQWEWTDSASYGKWGREFQAYRYKRAYFPSGVSDEFDYGTKTIVSKNKLRGRGRTLSLKLSTEAGKDLQLLGWSMAIGTNSNY